MRKVAVGVLFAVLVAGWGVTGLAGAALPSPTRIAGADRNATAASVSAATFGPGVDVVYVATGTNFPDALSGGPAGAKTGGPVLLVTSSAVPPSTATELDRLDPDRIVVLGGTAVISESVKTALQQYTTGAVSRIAGATRYETSAMISADAFAPGVPAAYVATGLNYPDALAAAAAAGSEGGPVLLAATDSVPTAVGAELDRLNPAKIVLVGGTTALSASVASAVGPYSATVVRRAGADRYLTSVKVSEGAFATADRVYIATGLNFPDALASGPPAGIGKDPLLLVPGTCVTPEVNAEVSRLNPGSSRIIGGEVAVSAAAAAGQVCQAPPAAAKTFGAGTFAVGSQVPPGTYRTRSNDDGCYWARLSGFSGELSAILANELTNFHTIVTIAPTDAGFETSGCATWTNDLSPLTGNRLSPFGSGSWIVNTDIEPGTWSAPGGPSCYWQRVSGFSGELKDVIANDFASANPIVTIAPTDRGFETSDCGNWTRT